MWAKAYKHAAIGKLLRRVGRQRMLRLMQTWPIELPEAHAPKGTPLSPLSHRFGPLGLPEGAESLLYLRFEPMRRLGAGDGTVGVLASWRPQSLCLGNVDAVQVLTKAECEGLLLACRAIGVRVVDNRPT